jgi:adenylate cyclase
MDLPYFLAFLAETYARAGDTEPALAALDEALTMVSSSRAFFYQAELHRLTAAMLLQQHPQDNAAAAETHLLRALDVARTQQARSLELRAALSLGRLWQQQGDYARGRKLVADVYCGFDEGFDTTDLQQAQAFVDQSVHILP